MDDNTKNGQNKVLRMYEAYGLKTDGLTAQDRTPEEKKEIEEINRMDVDTNNVYDNNNPDQYNLTQQQLFNQWYDYSKGDYASKQKDYSGELVQKAEYYNPPGLEEYYKKLNRLQQTTRSGINVHNKYTSDIKDIADRVSPHYKKYKFSDELTLTDAEWNNLAAEYIARYETYGEDQANDFLEGAIKENVASNQNLLEKTWSSITGMGADAAGSSIAFAGMIYGLAKAALGNYDKNENLNGFYNVLNSAVDNKLTNYGRDVMRYGTLWPDLLKEAKETDIAYHELLSTQKQEDSFFNINTPFELFQQYGFTAASMGLSFGLAGASSGIFNLAKRGVLGTTKTLNAAKKWFGVINSLESFNDAVIIPGLVGSMEGVVEGLETKKGVEDEGNELVYATQRNAVEQELKDELKNYQRIPKYPNSNEEDITQNDYVDSQGNKIDVFDLYSKIWKSREDDLNASLAQVETMATKAGVANFIANSVINGFINSTFKAGLHAPKVEKALRKGKLTGWAFGDILYDVKGSWGNATVTPTISNLQRFWQYVKEPFGEFKEEYLQTLTDKFFSRYASSSIHDFIDKKYNTDTILKIGDASSENWAAAWTALKKAAVSKEAIKSGVYGALSSVFGGVYPGRRTNKLDENGNVILKKNEDGSIKTNRKGEPIAEKTLFRRGQSADGDRETRWEAFKRWVPWRSGLVENIYNVNQNIEIAREQAKAIENWLNSPENKDKFDGLVGSLAWMKDMETSSSVGDEYYYRTSKLGKMVNDVIMLEKIKGSELYKAIMKQITDVAYMEKDSDIAKQYIQSIRDNVNENSEEKTDDEIFDELQSNAKNMLDIMAKVRGESAQLDKLKGNMDDDTKQSLIYGILSAKDQEERGKQVNKELNDVEISNSVENSTLSSKQKKFIAKYGNIKRAVKIKEKLEEQIKLIDENIKDIFKRSKDTKTKISDEELEYMRYFKYMKKEYQKELKDINKNLSEFSDDIDYSDYVLSEEDIMSLDPKTRADFILNVKHALYKELYQSTSKGKEVKAKGDNETDNGKTDKGETGKIENNKEENKTNVSEGNTKEENTPTSYQNIRDNSLQLSSHDNSSNEGTHKFRDQLKNSDYSVIESNDDTKEQTNGVTEKQAKVIDNLISQGNLVDGDFLKKIVDAGRIASAKDHFVKQYNEVLAKPEELRRYTALVKRQAADEMTKERAREINKIQDYGEFATSLLNTFNSISMHDKNIMHDVLRDNPNFKKLLEQSKIVERVHNLFNRNEKFKSMDGNSADLLIDAVNYLYTNGVDIKDENAVRKALEEQDENGYNKFAKFVDDINSTVNDTRKVALTSIDDVYKTYEDVIGQVKEDIARAEEQSKPIDVNPKTQQNSPTAPPTTTAPSTSESPLVTTPNTSQTDSKSKQNETNGNQKQGIFAGDQVYGSADEGHVDAKDIDTSSDNKKGTKKNDVQGDNKKQQTKENKGTTQQVRPSNNDHVNDNNVELYNYNELARREPNNPIVAFYKEHGVVQFLSKGTMNGNTKIYFMVDERLENDVKSQTPENYKREEDLPIVVVVQDDNGQYTVNEDGKEVKYQVIGVVPSRKIGTKGVARFDEIRKIAPNSGFITINGNKLRTTPIAGGVKATNPDNNVRTNKDFKTLIKESEFHIKNIIDRLRVVPNKKGDRQLAFGQSRMNTSGENLIFLIRKSIKDTTGKDTGKTLLETVNSGSTSEIVNFNSRTSGVAAVFKNFLELVKSADNVTDVENNVKYLEDKLSNCLYFEQKSQSRWKLAIEHIPGDAGIINGSRAYVLSVKSEKGVNIELATFTEDSNAEQLAAEFIKNIISDNGEWRVIDNNGNLIVGWQVNYSNVDASHEGNTNAIADLSNIIEDGILEAPATSLMYDNITTVIDAPLKLSDNQPRYPVEANPDNASSVSPIRDDQVKMQNGAVIDADSGAVISGNPEEPKSNFNKNLDSMKERIKSDSETFELDESEDYYVNTKTQRKHLRVTKIISADEFGEKFDDDSPFKLPSTMIGNSVHSIIEDFFIGKNLDKFIKKLKELYPNVNKEDLDRFINQLKESYPSVNKENLDTFIKQLKESYPDVNEDDLNKFFKQQLKESYPNVSKEDLDIFVKQLKELKAILSSKNIEIFASEIKCDGILEVTDSNRNIQYADICGSIDLLGVDDKGHYYIFDIKTFRDKSKFTDGDYRHKWSLQTSLYQKFLENKYGIKFENRIIIPVFVKYDDPHDVKYEEGENGQLIANGENFKTCSPTIQHKGLLPVDYVEPKIQIDKLSDKEKEMLYSIIDINTSQTQETQETNDENETGETNENPENDNVENDEDENPVINSVEVADENQVVPDLFTGCDVGVKDDILKGVFADTPNDNNTSSNSVNGEISIPVKGKTKWEDLNEYQRKMLEGRGETKESWNATESEAEVNQVKKCNE